jgi:hypothetical protein
MEMMIRRNYVDDVVEVIHVHELEIPHSQNQYVLILSPY